MKILLISSRFPWPPYTGDRLRAEIWLRALASRHQVTFVSPPGERALPIHGVEHVPAVATPAAIIPASLEVMRSRLPAHALIAAGYDWKKALAGAHQRHVRFDAAVVLLSRCAPWVDSMINADRKILDAIDSLAASTEERARAARGAVRSFWRFESRRTAALESRLASRYDEVVVVNPAECRYFGSNCRAIGNGVEVDALVETTRDFDVGFWGRLAYFANERAARLLLSDIWPRIRKANPAARLLIGGADAPTHIRAWHGRDGVTVMSPMENRVSTLRRVRIALFPFAFGTGQSNKVLEAAEAGCAVVSTPQGVRGLDEIARHAALADDPAELAQRTIDYLADEALRLSAGAALRDAVVRHHSREATHRAMNELLAREQSHS